MRSQKLVKLYLNSLASGTHSFGDHNTDRFKLDAVREQQDPPCTLLSLTSTIFSEGYNFKYETEKKSETIFVDLNAGSIISIIMATVKSIGFVLHIITSLLQRRSPNVSFSQLLTMSLSQWLSHNGFLITSFSQRRSDNHFSQHSFAHNIKLYA